MLKPSALVRVKIYSVLQPLQNSYVSYDQTKITRQGIIGYAFSGIKRLYLQCAGPPTLWFQLLFSHREPHSSSRT